MNSPRPAALVFTTEGLTKAASPRLVVRNTVLRAVAELLSKALSFVLFVAIARVLGTKALGAFTLATTFASIIYVFADFGSDRFLMREVARGYDYTKHLFADIVSMRTIGGLLGVAVTCIGVRLLGYGSTVEDVVGLVGVSYILMLIGMTATTVFQAFEHTQYYFVSIVPSRFVNGGLGLLALAVGGGIVMVAGTAVVAAALGAIVAMALLCRRFPTPRWSVDPTRWWRLLCRTTPFGASQTFNQLLIRFDVVLLSLYVPQAAIGRYGASYKLVEALFFVVWAVTTSVMPSFTYSSRHTDPPLGDVFVMFLRLAISLTLPVSIALSMGAATIIGRVYGAGYGPAIVVLQLIGPSLVLYAIADVCGALMQARGRPRRMLVLSTGAVVVNVALNLVLIPTLGIQGAAIATLAAYALLAIAAILVAASTAQARPTRAFVSPALAGLVMVMTMWLLARHGLYALLGGFVTYATVLAILELWYGNLSLEFLHVMLKRAAS